MAFRDTFAIQNYLQMTIQLFDTVITNYNIDT